jgi:tRNA-dihydrouridine synthase A
MKITQNVSLMNSAEYEPKLVIPTDTLDRTFSIAPMLDRFDFNLSY